MANPASDSIANEPVNPDENRNRKLERVAGKQKEWRTLAAMDKYEILSQMLQNLLDIPYRDHLEYGYKAVDMMGIPSDSIEGECEASASTFFTILFLRQSLSALRKAYRVRAAADAAAHDGTTVKTKDKPTVLPTRMSKTTQPPQVIITTCPITTEDKFGPFAKCRAELWLDPSQTEMKSYDFEYFETRHFDSSNSNDGAMLVLGGGNQPFLSAVDSLDGLFQSNRVVYLLYHPLRSSQDGLIRRIFAPLIDKGYFDTETFTSLERSQELTYTTSLVSHVHLTGSKATHDAIVWGSDPKERQERIQKGTPLLQATMTSELGCVTPWIVMDGHYAQDALHSQVLHMCNAVHSNASANCNAPKLFIMSQGWAQQEEFMNAFIQEWESHPLPCAYYPKATDRWEQFRKEYPDAQVVDSKTGQGIEERRLTTPLLGTDGPVLLPLLVIHLTVDLSTEEGREKASAEYAFRTEPFAPVIVFVTLAKQEGSSFLETAVEFCNDHAFGTLSCSLTVPPEVDGSIEVETAIAKLRYGAVVINSWSAYTYLETGLVWGAAPGERLDAVQTGIGSVNNLYFVPHVQKSVLRFPIMGTDLQKPLDRNLKRVQNERTATSKFFLKPGLVTFAKLIWSSRG